MPDLSSDFSRTVKGLGRTALLSAAILALIAAVASASLSENPLASQTVGPGAENVVALNFTFDGDQVLNGSMLEYNYTLDNFSQVSAWDIDSYDDSPGGNWDSSSDFLANDTDEDGVYTSRNDTVIAGTLNLANGDGLVEGNPWGNVTFYDDGDGSYNASDDAIVNDFDNDSYVTNATLDVKLNGTSSLSEGALLQVSKPENWTNVSFNETGAKAGWQFSADAVILHNDTTNWPFNETYNADGDILIAGSAPEDNASVVYDRPSRWTDIKFYNGSEMGWDEADDAIVNDTAGNGTYSTRNDTTINGTNLSDGVELSESNPFTSDPGLAFNDSEPDGNWSSGDVILRDYGNLTVSSDNDTLIAGTAPGEGVSYTNQSDFYHNWTLYSVDKNEDGGAYNSSTDSIVYDDDNNSVFGHQLNALTMEVGGSATEQDIENIALWAENDSTSDDSVFDGYSSEAKLGNLSYESNRWVIGNLTWNFTSSEPFYATVNVSDDPIGMPGLQLEVSALNDNDGSGTLNDTGDTGFFVKNISDTGGLTGTTEHKIYTPSITKITTNSTANGNDQFEEVVITFSEPVNISDGNINDGLPSIEISDPLLKPANGFWNRSFADKLYLKLNDTGGKDEKPGVKYVGDDGIIAANASGPYELTRDNSSVNRVDGVNNKPTADAGGDDSVEEGESLNLDCDSSTDSEGDELDCRWKITDDLTDTATIEGETEGTWVSGDTVTFDAPSVDEDTYVSLRLEVSETNSGLTDTTDFDILVTAAQVEETTTYSTGGGGGEDTSDESDEEETDEPPTNVTESVVVGGGQSKQLDVGAETVGSLELVAKSGRDIIGSIEYEETESRPSNVPDPEGEDYRFIEIERNDFENQDIESAEFDFKVSKDWLSNKEVAPETVRLQRYESNWSELETSKSSEDSESVHYTATSPGFSVFSITGDTYQSLFKVKDIRVRSDEVKKGENATIEVTVRSGAESEASYSLEVEAGNETLSRKVTVPGNSTKTVFFTKTFEEAGTHKVSVGGQQAEIQVKSGGSPWLLIGVLLVFSLLAAFGIYLFWPEIHEELESLGVELSGLEEAGFSGSKELPEDLEAIPGKIRDAVEGIGSSDSSSTDYSFKGFGDGDDYDYSFDQE